MRQRSCSRCGETTVVLQCFDAKPRTFSAVELSDPDVPETERWYLRRDRGVIHGGLIDAPADLPYLTLHVCSRTRLGTGQSAKPLAGHLGIDTEIARRVDQPTIEQLPLAIPGRVYSYRYPSSWAHIVAGADNRGLCGDRVLDPDAMLPREAARLNGMRVCPRCRARNTWDETRSREIG